MLFDVLVVAGARADTSSHDHHAFTRIPAADTAARVEAARKFQPHVIHGHYLHQVPQLAEMARALDVPFTVRAHSYDVLGANSAAPAKYSDDLNSELCLAIFSFPFTRSAYIAAGVDGARVTDAYPVVDVARFHDTTPNGPGVMNVGAALGKKAFPAYLQLAASGQASRPFSLYAMGYQTDDMCMANRQRRSMHAAHPR
jgi:hypothetical protein